MANDLKLQVLLAAIDRVTGPFRKIRAGSSDTAKALRAAKDQLKELDRAQQQITGFRKLSRDAHDSGIAMRAAYQHVAKLKAQMQGVETPTKRAARALATAEREATKLKNAHIGQLRALKDSKARLAAAGVEVKKLEHHEARLRAEMARTTQQIDKQTAHLARLAQQNQRAYLAQRSLHKTQAMAGAAGSAGATLGATAAAAAAPVLFTVKAYAQWEDAMLGVARQVPGARDKFGNLMPIYYEMGDAITAMSERLPMAATDIAALVEAAARMGIKGRDNLLAFAETTAIGSAAFKMPAEQIGTDMAKIANAYKVPLENIRELGDAINWLDDNTNAQGADIIDALQRMSDVADKMNFKQASALASTFLSLGSSPEIAASAARAMVRELSIAEMQPKRFQAGLKALGLDARQLQRNMAKDAEGTILSVMDAINRAAPEDRTTLATRLFGKEFGDDAAKLANNVRSYREQIAMATSSDATGSMDREASARLKNLSSGWQLLKNYGVNTAKALGAELAPTLMEIMRSVQSMLGNVRAWVKANPQLAGTLLKVAAGASVVLATLSGLALGASAVLGPFAVLRYAVTTLGIRFGPLLSKIMPLARNAIPMLMQGARMLLPLLGGLSAPVLAVIAAVAAAGFLLWKYWQPIKAFLVGMWQGIREAAGPVLQELGQALAPLRPVWEWFVGVLGRVWTWLKQFFTPMQATSAQLQNATNYGRAFGQVLGTVMLGPLRLVIAGVGALVKWMQIAFNYSPLGILMRNWNAITGFLQGLIVRFKAIGGQLMDGLVSGLLGGLGRVAGTIDGIGGNVVGWMKAKLGIRSPSRIFAQLGDYTMQGLAGGLDRSRMLPLRALSAVAGNLRSIGAGIAISAAATPAVAIDQRAPLTPSMAAAGGGGATYNITINAGAGTPAQDIAQLVRAEIERIERERAARQRSRLGDYGN